jgi:hypothetical protein
MKKMISILISGLLLCGCSHKWAKSDTPAIDLVQPGKDISWGSGVVLHVERRTANSVEGVRLTSTARDGQKTTVTSSGGTLLPGSVENPADGGFVRLTLQNAQIQSATQSLTAGEYMTVLGKRP